MFFQTFHPGPRLGRFVDSFWLYYNESQSLARGRGLPSGKAQLIFDLSGEGFSVSHRTIASRLRGACLTLFNGADTTYCTIETNRPVYQIGVDFKPGGAYPFFAPPAGELQNAHVPLDALWGMRAAELWERLMAAPTVEARCQTLEQALLAQAVRPLERRPAVAFALRAFECASRPRSIALVEEEVDLSHTRFIQVFRDEVGLNPKQFCRVRRFIRVVESTYPVKSQAERPDWASLALECGYYDQAHLTHDFQHFAGVSPGVFMRDRSPLFPTDFPIPNGQDILGEQRDTGEREGVLDSRLQRVSRRL
jgi:AraC-like DNA-binding protein